MNEFVKEWTEAFGTSSYQKNIILEVSLPCRRDQWRANCSEFCCYSTGKAWACSGWCCVAVFEWSSIFQGSTLRQKVNKNSRESLKLTRFTSPPPQRKHERLQRVTFGYRKLQRKLWQAQLLERSQDDSTTWKRLSSTDPTWKEQASTCSGTCKLCSRSPTFVSCHPCWGGLWWCRCLWVISSPVSNPSLTFL